MRTSGRIGVAVAAVVLSLAGAGPAHAASKDREPLNQYVVTGGDPEQLARSGVDLNEGRQPGGGHGIVATPSQAAALRAKGFTVTAPFGVTRQQQAAPPNPFADPNLTHGYDVFRPWRLNPAPCPDHCSGAVDAQGQPVNLRTWYENQRLAHTDIVKKETYGATRFGEPLVAYRVTVGANSSGDATKPVVVYESTQHAREWIATEVERRWFEYVLAHANDQGTAIPGILRNTELWFIPVMNPDGYDYTFLSKANRLWRRNLADNDGDNQLTNLDGVDPNRNWAEKWRYDEEGADDTFGSDVYRGKAPESEPEISGADALFARIRPRYLIDYHSYGPLILYPEGWQVATEGTDSPAMKALAGTPSEPAIPGFVPEVSAQLYTTNGDVTDNAYFKYGTQAYTVELEPGSGNPIGGTDGDEGSTPGGFVFQDRELDVQAEATKNRDFALDLAKSAQDPSKPVSHLGNTAPDLVQRTFKQSYGSPQTVEVNARRALGAVQVNWRVNNGPVHTAPTAEYLGGAKYGTPGMYYHRLRGTVSAFQAGDQVKVWFSGGGAETDPFTFSAVTTTPGDVLVMAAEDYSGPSSVTGAGPHAGPVYLDYYRQALQTLGVSYDVYDVDGAGRAAPDALGVLSHYKAVVWYTGDDLYVREPGEPGGTGNSKLLQDEIIATRDYLNDGGKLLVTGQNALQGSWDQFLENPLGSPPNSYCKSNQTATPPDDDIPPGQSDACVITSNDFIQYYLGAWINIQAAADPAAVAALPFERAGGVFGTSPFRVNGAGSADNQQGVYTFVPTSDILKADQFPQFSSKVSTKFDRPSAFDPTSGTHYAYAKSSDESYQRLRRTIDLTGATTARLKFKLSWDTEPNYDYVFVEAHTVGQDDWTTLPDANGNTSDDVGSSCDIDWNTLHPFLDHYQSNPTPAADCTNHGTTGDWNGATGNSGGFQDWDVDLAKFKGKQVEVSITYAQDFATEGLGVFLDDVQVLKNGAVTETQDFENGLGGWTAGPPPAGTANQAGWIDSTSVGFTDGPGIATNQTELWGFGLEAVRTPADRAKVLGDALHYLASTTVPLPGLGPEIPLPAAPAAPAAPAPAKPGSPSLLTAPKLVLAKRYRVDRKGRVKIKVHCSSTIACTGIVKLVRGKVLIAKHSYSVRPGKTATVTLTLTKAAQRSLKRAKSQRIKVKLYRGTTKVVSTRAVTLRRA